MLKKTLENPLDSKEVKPVLSEVNPEYSLERLMLKLQYLGCLVRRANSWEGTLMLGKTLESPLDCKEIQPVHPKGNEYLLEVLSIHWKD